MCEIYVSTDPILYESRTRSLRIHGAVTTVRLENLFWNVLQEISEREGMTTNQFLEKLHDELFARYGEPPMGFASFLRVCCLRYLSRASTRDKQRVDDTECGFRPMLVNARP